MTDQYQTLKLPAEGYYMDRGSKFHAYAFPVTSEAEISELLLSMRKEHPKARHFCTAFRLFPDASLERSNDDGEPSGSAGKPILGQLIKNNLTNVMVVVVRYFGGTKLGIPGLIEAYKTSTGTAIKPENIIQRIVHARVKIEMRYDSFPHFLNFCKQLGMSVTEDSFTDKVMLSITLPKSRLDDVLLTLLKNFSRMDFMTMEEYLIYLDMNIDFIPGDIIL